MSVQGTLRVLLGGLALVLVAAVGAGCIEESEANGLLEVPETADAEAGADLIQQYGCGTCHVIPGIAGANSRVGPSLEDFANQYYIAGALRNNWDNLVRWLIAPDAIEPGTIMPTFGFPEEVAANIAAYLATLD